MKLLDVFGLFGSKRDGGVGKRVRVSPASVFLLDGDAGVMRDPAGHEGFSSFDDALVLRRGGDAGTS